MRVARAVTASDTSPGIANCTPTHTLLSLRFHREQDGERDDRHQQQDEREIATPRTGRQRDRADERQRTDREADTDRCDEHPPVA